MDGDPTIRIVGRRSRPHGGLETADALLKLVIELRGDKPFIPRGVHRFKTFEEEDQWSLRMMTRSSLRARRP